jgi:hypothetical protein
MRQCKDCGSTLIEERKEHLDYGKCLTCDSYNLFENRPRKKICRYCDNPARMEIKMVTGRLEEKFGVCYMPACMIHLQETVKERRQLERQWLHEDIDQLTAPKGWLRTDG